MQRVLLAAATTGYQTRRFAEAIARLGHTVVLATDRCHIMDDPWGDRAQAVKFDDPETSAAHLDTAAGRIDAVIALSDQPTQLAAAFAARRGLLYHPFAAVQAAGDKHIAKAAWQRAELRVPRFVRVPLAGDPDAAAAEAMYPCVLKPLHLSASRGVIRADDPASFVAAFRRIRALLDHNEEYLQVEEYIPGREFALEGIVTGGQLRVLAVFDKPDPLEGPYFEETLYVTPSSEAPAVVADLIGTTAKAVAALGLTHGPVHAEMRWNERGVWMLEAAARPIGGLCAQALRFGAGGEMPLEELLVRHALGADVSRYPREEAASGVLMVPIPKAGIYQSVTGEEDARAIPGITQVAITAKPGQALVPLPEGASYLGFLFARADFPLLVEQALRQAHAALRFTIQTSLPVFSPA